MGLTSNSELSDRLAWSELRVGQLEEQCESWRNKALLAQAKLRELDAENLALRQKLSRSLPLYDPDQFIPGKG